MKTILVICSLLAITLSAPQRFRDQSKPQAAQIIQQENNNDGLGPYSFSYQSSDGSSRQESGEIVNAGTDNELLVVRGSYSYIGADGSTYTVTYIADENGFRPTGTHISSR